MSKKKYFFIVGAQRSSTTYLYTILDEHPEICMAKPVKPEPKFFLNKTDEDFDEDEYLKTYFSYSTDRVKIFGEKSTSYYENESVAKYISQKIPNAKIIFILSDPVKRAISNYKFSVENGFEKRSIEDVFLNSVDESINGEVCTSVNPFNYLERGIYHKYLEYYYKYFPKNNIKVLIKEEFINNKEEIRNLYNFLGVENSFTPNSISKIINRSKSNICIDKLKTIKEVLASYYQKHNKILENKYKINIDIWSNN